MFASENKFEGTYKVVEYENPLLSDWNLYLFGSPAEQLYLQLLNQGTPKTEEFKHGEKLTILTTHEFICVHATEIRGAKERYYCYLGFDSIGRASRPHDINGLIKDYSGACFLKISTSHPELFQIGFHGDGAEVVFKKKLPRVKITRDPDDEGVQRKFGESLLSAKVSGSGNQLTYIGMLNLRKKDLKLD